MDELGLPITWDENTGFSAATPGIDSVVNSSGVDWSAGAVNPAATDWGDVLKFGFSRLVDAKVRPVTPQNTVPVLATKTAPGAIPASIAGLSPVTLAVVGLVLVGAFYFLSKRSA